MTIIIPHNHMKNNEILTILPATKKLKSVRLPSSIDFSLEKDILKVTLSDVTGNMQENKSAFEGWIICFKSWLPLKIRKVELEWVPPTDPTKKLHYNRFLFRVIQFQEMYSWFSVSEINFKTVQQFSKDMLLDKWINYPLSGKLDSKSESKKEDKIESLFVNKYKPLLMNKLNLKTLNQQLPVGIFKGSVNSKNYFFTGQKSAIDLWGVNGCELSIFELKFENKCIGIISELLFYLYLSRAVFVTKEIKYPSKAENTKHRGFNKLYESNIQKIKGYFLIDELHPLIGKKAINLLNAGLVNLGDLSVEKLKYKCIFGKQKLSWK